MSKIEWTDATWNPVVGCSLVSPGCTNCYAMRQAHALVERFDSAKYRGLTKRANGAPVWTGVLRLDKATLAWPLQWRVPRRIFVNSMSDLFHEALADEDVDKVFAVMSLAPQHQFQVLTKRPRRMRAYFHDLGARAAAIGQAASKVDGAPCRPITLPLPNVWLGVSVEDQRRADLRVRTLLQTPASLRFVSCEPLLEAVDLTRLPWPDEGDPRFSALAGILAGNVRDGRASKIDWIIVGGESGPRARAFDIEWARSIIWVARAAGTPVFVKQLGSCPRSGSVILHLRDRKGGKPDEWPEDLRVREFPT